MKKLLKEHWPILVWIILAFVIFSPAFGKYIMFPCPDSAPQSTGFRIRTINDLLSGSASTSLHDLLPLVMSPFAYNDLTYPIDILLAAIGFAWFLTGRGIKNVPAAFAGGVFAFMAYSLTLFSAGHRFYFFMMPYQVFLFAFLVRAIQGKGLVYYALSAFCATWLIRFGPDVGTIFLGIAVIYAVFLLVRRYRLHSDEKAMITRQTVLGAVVGIITFALAAAPTIKESATTLLSGRKAQIEQSAGMGAQKASAEANGGDSEDQTKWIFATNWSLPPDETLEFVAPAVKGRQSGDPESPYWGRLGRSWKWEETHDGFTNFRQHLVYIGAIPLSLALLAFVSIFAAGKKGDEDRAECIFWSVAFVVGLLLAFGRYTPFYRLFYSIPGMSYLRAPVKFMRLVEFSTAVLAGYGAMKLANDAFRKEKSLRIVTIATAALAAIFAIFALAVKFSPDGFCTPLKELGAAKIVPVMAEQAVTAIMHAIVGFALIAVVAALRRSGKIGGNTSIAILSIAVAIDLAIAERPFAFTRDYEYQYTATNPLAAAAAPIRPAPSAAILVDDQNLAEALRNNLAMNLVGCHPRRDLDHMKFLSRPEVRHGGIIRLFELCGCSHMLVQASQAREMLGGRVEPLSGYRLCRAPQLLEKTNAPGKDDFMLFRILAPKPYAKLYAHWSHAAEGDFLGEVASKMGPEDSDIIVIGNETPCDDKSMDGSAETLKVQGIDGALESVIRTKAPSRQVLALTRGYNKDTVVLVDGEPASQFMAGYAGTGVFVPAGEHIVTIRSRNRNLPIAIASFAMLAIFLLLIGVAIKQNHAQ